MKAQPFKINVAQDVLDDLQNRLEHIRWPDEVQDSGWDYGTNRSYLKSLAAYWHDTFDWRTQEKQLNTFSQFRTEIDHATLHFIHERGKGPNPMPLLLLHGWPDSFYRFYKDDWGLMSHTIDMETSIKLTPFVSVTPFYRFYDQTASKYFAAYGQHAVTDQYYTSSYDQSKFTSGFFGAGVRFAPVHGVLGISHLSTLELRYGHYDRSNGLNSDIISLNLKFK